MNIKCDICDIVFRIEVESLKVTIRDTVTINYFECTKCNHKYITACYDEYVLKEQKKLKRLDEMILKTNDLNEKQDLIARAQRLMKHLKTHSDRLKIGAERLLNL
ncbi:MAG: hypothetical protein RR460_04325 [Clostridium sp.]